MAFYVARSIPGMHQATVWVNFQKEAVGAGIFEQFTSNFFGVRHQNNNFDKLKHDLKLGVYASSVEVAQDIANRLKQDYGTELNQYAEFISDYGEGELAFYYFVERHLRIVRHKDDGFFVFIWYFYDKNLAKNQLESIVGYIEDAIVNKLNQNLVYSIKELEELIPQIDQPKIQEQAASLKALYKSQQKLLTNEQIALFKISPVEVSAGWVFPSFIKVLIAVLAPLVLAYVLFINWRLAKNLRNSS